MAIFLTSYFQLILLRKTFAGIPPTNEYAGISLLTNAPATMTAPSPMITPFKIVAFRAIQKTYVACILNFQLTKIIVLNYSVFCDFKELMKYLSSFEK